MIQRLAKSRGGAGLDELAEELGCVRRTVYRDLDALMYAGFPVVSEKRDGKAYYRFLDQFQLGQVPFTPDELHAGRRVGGARRESGALLEARL